MANATSEMNTVLIEITRAWVKKSGRVIEPGPLSVVRVTNELADTLESMGVAKKLNIPGKCIHTELARRRRELRKQLQCS